MNEEQLYINGFNHGYLLTKHEPDLVSKITQTVRPTNDYLSGFFSGKQEWELELTQMQLQDLSRLREQSREHRDLDRDK